MSGLRVRSLNPLPEVRPGDDLASLIVAALADANPADPSDPAGPAIAPEDGHVVAIAHKVVSKAEGAVVSLSDIQPSEHALALAAEAEAATGQPRDPRAIQVVLDQSTEVLRAQRGVLICRTHHGFVCANAGVDASNVSGSRTSATSSATSTSGSGRTTSNNHAEVLVTLPRDPDASARALRARLYELTGARPAVLITDSFGRAWRQGQVDVAIGLAGLQPLDDWRGRTDAHGLELRATLLAIADAVAATADLARMKDSREPVVLIEGLGRLVANEDGPGAAALVRPLREDLFR